MWGGRGGRGACACACGGGGWGGGGGGVILGEVKARPKDIISFSLDYISKSKVQTSNPSSSLIPLDTPARPADFPWFQKYTNGGAGFLPSTVRRGLMKRFSYARKKKSLFQGGLV